MNAEVIRQEQLQSHFVTVSGRQVHYQTYGSGDVVVLIHGGGPGAFGYSNFKFNIGPLAQRNKVVVIDLPGYGLSQYLPATESLFEPMSQAVIGVLDDLGCDKASLVGNSLGGGTAIRTALNCPDRIKKLILMGPGGGLPLYSSAPSEGLLRMLTFYDGEGPTLEKLRRVVDLLVFDPSSISAQLLQERFEAATRPDIVKNPPLKGRGANPKDDLWREALYTLPHPTLIIWGREDRVLSLDHAFVFLKAIPNAHLHVFPKCGHWVQWEKSDAFNRLVDDFLSS